MFCFDKNSTFLLSAKWVKKSVESFKQNLNDLFNDVKMYTKQVQIMSIFNFCFFKILMPTSVYLLNYWYDRIWEFFFVYVK